MQLRFLTLGLALAGSLSVSQLLTAQQTPRQEGRQEARQERREGRQTQQAQQAQQQPAQQRQQAAQQAANRASYFSDSTWTQLDPWITRNRVQPLQRSAQAAANATGRAAEATANAAGRAADATARTADRAADATARAADRAADATNRAVDRAADATNRTVDRAADATNRAANATNRAADRVGTATANATERTAANARFGFNNPNVANTNDAWFYDYYSYNPTVYSGTGGKAYSSAARYYDSNNDGVYDNLSTYRDADSDGRFDAYDRLDFAEVKSDTAESVAFDGPSDASRHTVSGTVEAMKVAKVNGSENLVAKLATDQRDKLTIVDLGSAERWKSDAIREGDQLTATGPVEQIGEKQIVVAESVSVGKQKEVRIARSGPRVQGVVVDVTTAEVKGTQHTMAVIESDSSRQIVDLGPTESLKVKVQPQTKIAVQGVPVQFRDYSVVLADEIDLDGQQITIQRWK